MISFIFSASQMLILNPSRCKREGVEDFECVMDFVDSVEKF